MPAETIAVRNFDGSLGTLIPRGPLCFGGAQLLNDGYHNLPTFLSYIRGTNQSPSASENLT